MQHLWKNTYLRYLVRNFFIWTWALIFWHLMRLVGQEVEQDHLPSSLLALIRLHLVVGIFSGFLFGTLDYLLKRYVLKRISFGKTILIGSAGYLLAALLLLLFGITLVGLIKGTPLNGKLYFENVFAGEIALLIFYCFQVGFIVNFVQEIDKKVGPGNLWKMVKGEFYTPKEDERLFMFLDLRSSTSIAEKMGHIQYSQLLQDCFKDLEVIKKYKAEIYQYVGDEVVLTWPKEAGLDNLNCLNTYVAFKEKLLSKQAYYKERYGIVPKFSAGLNVGKIVVAEVGEIKSEIAYHGDTINTAARIQKECNRLNEDILISENLKMFLPSTLQFQYELADRILLRGKEKEVNLYSVQKVDSSTA